MMQEQLAAHQIEREVMETPSDEEETAQGVVFDHFSCGGMRLLYTLRTKGTLTVLEILVAPLCTEDQ